MTSRTNTTSPASSKLRILQLFDRNHRLLTGAEVSRALKIPRTTAFRLAQTLERLGSSSAKATAFASGRR